MAEEQEYVSLPLMTLGQAAAYLGVGRRVIYQLIENGQLRAVKANGSVRLEKSSVEGFKENGILT